MITTTRTVKQWPMHPYRGENELVEVRLEEGEQIIYMHDRDSGGIPVRTIVIGRYIQDEQPK